MTGAYEDNNTSLESRLDVEALGQSLVSLQLRQENDRLRQAVDVLCQAHANLSEDLTLKNDEIAQLKSRCSNLKLQAAELSEKVNLLELELAELNDSSHGAELSVECAGLRDAALPACSTQQKEMTISSLQEVLAAEREKMQLLTEQLDEAQSKMTSQQTEVAAAGARNSDLTAQNIDLQLKLELAEKECSDLQLSLNTLHEKGDQLLCLQNEYRLQCQSLKVSEERYEVLQQHCNQLATALSAEHEKMQLLTNQLTEEQSKVISLQTEVAAAAARNGDLTAQNADLQLKLAAAEKECSDVQLSLNVLREKGDSENGELRDQLLCLQNEYQLQVQSLKVSEERYEVLQQHCNQLTTALSAEHEKMQLLMNQLAEEQSKVISQQTEVAAAFARNCDLTAQNADLQHELELVKKDCSDLQFNTVHETEQHEEKCEVLQQHCEQLTTENANLKLQVLHSENKQAEMQAKIDGLELSLQGSEKDLVESRNMAEECLCEKAMVQKELLNAENERDGLRTELADFSSQYRSIEKSLLESQEKLVQRDQQVEEKDHDLNHVRQQIAGLRETMLALQQELKREQSEEMERKQQAKKLKKETENLKEIVATQNGTIVNALAAKEECDKQTAVLQVQTECLTSEKVNLEQQVRILEDCNISLQKDRATLTDSYETAKKLSTELQLRVDQLYAREQSLSEQLEQKDEVIRQLISEKEEVNHSLAAVKLKVNDDALERSAHLKHIAELEEQIGAVKDDVSMHKELTEQLKRSFSDSEHERERCQKVISDFEEQCLLWKDEKLQLEGRIIELQNYVINFEKDVQAMRENQNVQRTDIDNSPTVRNTENVKVSYNNQSDTDDHQRLEFIQTLEAVEQKSEESDIENNIKSACALVHNPCPEPGSWNMRECQSLSINLQDMYEQCESEIGSNSCEKDVKKQLRSLTKDVSLKVKQTFSENEFECDMQAESDQIHSSEQFPFKAEEENLQTVMLGNAVTQENEHFELVVERNVETVDASDGLSEKNDAGDSSGVDKNKQYHPNLATSSERLLTVSDSHEGSDSVVCAEVCNVNKDPFNTENVACGNDPVVEAARDSHTAIADNASKREKRRVIKRFVRLPQSSAGLRHDRNPLPVHSDDLGTEAACGNNLAAPVEAVEQLCNYKGLQSNEASVGSVAETISSAKLQKKTGSILTSVSAVGVASDEACSTAICSVDVYSATEAVSSVCSSAGEQPSCLQTVSGRNQASDGCCQQGSDNGNSRLNTEPECTVTLNTIVNNDVSPGSKSKLDQTNKRLNTDVNNDNAKKLRSGLCA